MFDEFRALLKQRGLTIAQSEADLNLAFRIWCQEKHAEAKHLMAEYLDQTRPKGQL